MPSTPSATMPSIMINDRDVEPNSHEDTQPGEAPEVCFKPSSLVGPLGNLIADLNLPKIVITNDRAISESNDYSLSDLKRVTRDRSVSMSYEDTTGSYDFADTQFELYQTYRNEGKAAIYLSLRAEESSRRDENQRQRLGVSTMLHIALYLLRESSNPEKTVLQPFTREYLLDKDTAYVQSNLDNFEHQQPRGFVVSIIEKVRTLLSHKEVININESPVETWASDWLRLAASAHDHTGEGIFYFVNDETNLLHDGRIEPKALVATQLSHPEAQNCRAWILGGEKPQTRLARPRSAVRSLSPSRLFSRARSLSRSSSKPPNL